MKKSVKKLISDLLLLEHVQFVSFEKCNQFHPAKHQKKKYVLVVGRIVRSDGNKSFHKEKIYYANRLNSMLERAIDDHNPNSAANFFARGEAADEQALNSMRPGSETPKK